MLLLVAAAFIILRFPEIILGQIAMYYRTINSPFFEQTYIVLQMTNLLVILNHSANFTVYIIFFKSFREMFVGCFKLKCNMNRETNTKAIENASQLGSCETGSSNVSTNA